MNIWDFWALVPVPTKASSLLFSVGPPSKLINVNIWINITIIFIITLFILMNAMMRTPGVEVTVGKFFWEAQVVVVSVRAQQLGLGFQLKKVLNNVRHKYKDKVKYTDKDKDKDKVKHKDKYKGSCSLKGFEIAVFSWFSMRYLVVKGDNFWSKGDLFYSSFRDKLGRLCPKPLGEFTF